MLGEEGGGRGSRGRRSERRSKCWRGQGMGMGVELADEAWIRRLMLLFPHFPKFWRFFPCSFRIARGFGLDGMLFCMGI